MGTMGKRSGGEDGVAKSVENEWEGKADIGPESRREGRFARRGRRKLGLR